MTERKALEDLQSMPIDTISTLERGMPINALMDHSLRTIYDARHERVSDLMRLDGIGRISAEAIVEAVAKIKASVYEQAVPRINPDALTEKDFELLQAIYTKWKLSSSVEALEEQIDEFYEEVGSAIDTAKQYRNFLGSLFQSKATKEKNAAAFAALNNSKHQLNTS